MTTTRTTIARGVIALCALASALALAQPLTGVKHVAAGGDFSCALTNAGGVKCWGWNYGPVPVDIPGLGNIQALTVGGAHACVLTEAGGVKCWNIPGAYVLEGNLGDGTTNISTTPVDVAGLASGVAQVDAGGGHTCALLVSGGLKCWGVNTYGQVGNGASDLMGHPVTAPTDVAGLASGVTAISSGGGHTCAIAGGGVKCWGYTSWGQMGDGRSSSSPSAQTTPVDVPGLQGGVAAISAGGRHSCAVLAGGGVKCWGGGMLGDGGTQGSTVPVDVQGLAPGLVGITAGGDHTCATTEVNWDGVRFPGVLQCWGYNTFGKLGDTSLESRPLPTSVVGLGASQVSPGGYHTCAVTPDGQAKCWGRADTGALGIGPTTAYNTPGGVRSYPSTVGNFTRQQTIAFGTLPSRHTGEAPFSVSATASSGLPVQFTSITPTSCTVSGTNVTLGAMGICTLVAMQPGDATFPTAPAVTRSFLLRGSPIARLANLSARVDFPSPVSGGEPIAGFVIGGTTPKTIVLRSIGPSLAAHGVVDAHWNPYLMLMSPPVRSDNDDWQVYDVQFMQAIPNPDAQRIQEIGFAPSDPLEATMIRTLPPGAYTAMLARPGGVATLELYELDHPESPLVNLSMRGPVGTGDRVLIAGFVIQGDSPRTVAIVATGPSLAAHGVASPLADPTITVVRSADQFVIGTNDNWQTDSNAAALAAAGFAPANPLESAMLVTLGPGAYTAILRGAGGGTGTGVIGVYEVQ